MKYYVGDAFTGRLFGGGPAAVMVTDRWLPDELMQNISMENNLPDTAFAVKRADGDYDLRWFMPKGEIELNGHATLVCSYVIFHDIEPKRQEILYHFSGGEIRAARREPYVEICLPPVFNRPYALRPDMIEALGARPRETWFGENLLFVFDTEEEVAALEPDFARMGRLPEGHGCFVTAKAAPGSGYDIVGRTFWPKMGVDEDSVCGNMHCNLAPFWSERLGKQELISHQLSPRGAVVRCSYENERVSLRGEVSMFLTGELLIPDTF